MQMCAHWYMKGFCNAFQLLVPFALLPKLLYMPGNFSNPNSCFTHGMQDYKCQVTMKSYQDGGLWNDWYYAKINLAFLAYSSSNSDESNSDDNNSESRISVGALVCGISVFTNHMVKKKKVTFSASEWVSVYIYMCTV